MSTDISFTKENIDRYLKELAKEFRRLNGNKMPTEIVLIGGVSNGRQYRGYTEGCKSQKKAI